MFNINRAMFSGRLTRDAEVRNISNGCIVTLAVAINNRYKDKSGDWHTETAFVDVKTFGATADRCADLQKGTGVYIEGSIRQEDWETKEGQKRSKLVFRADTVKVDRDSQSAGEGAGNGQQTPARGYADAPAKDLWANSAPEVSDDIPF